MESCYAGLNKINWCFGLIFFCEIAFWGLQPGIMGDMCVGVYIYILF